MLYIYFCLFKETPMAPKGLTSLLSWELMNAETIARVVLERTQSNTTSGHLKLLMPFVRRVEK